MRISIWGVTPNRAMPNQLSTFETVKQHDGPYPYQRVAASFLREASLSHGEIQEAAFVACRVESRGVDDLLNKINVGNNATVTAAE